MKYIFNFLFITFTANITAQVPEYVSKWGLEGYWDFNGNCNDQAIKKNNALVKGGTYSTDKAGVNNSALEFNGQKQYVIINYLPTLSYTKRVYWGGFTGRKHKHKSQSFSFWFNETKVNNSKSNWPIFMYESNDEIGNYSLVISPDSNTIELIGLSSKKFSKANFTLNKVKGSKVESNKNQSEIIINKWNHVLIVCEHDPFNDYSQTFKIKVYLNNEEIISSEKKFIKKVITPIPQVKITLGANPNNIFQQFIGKIDNLIINSHENRYYENNLFYEMTDKQLKDIEKLEIEKIQKEQKLKQEIEQNNKKIESIPMYAKIQANKHSKEIADDIYTLKKRYEEHGSIEEKDKQKLSILLNVLIGNNFNIDSFLNTDFGSFEYFLKQYQQKIEELENKLTEYHRLISLRSLNVKLTENQLLTINQTENLLAGKIQYISDIDPINYSNDNLPPKLICSFIKFNDSNGILEGNEQSSISFFVKNIGRGTAKKIDLLIEDKSNTIGLYFDRTISISEIKPNDSILINLILKSDFELKTGNTILNFSFNEKLGFPPDPFEVYIQTKIFERPFIKIVDYSFISEKGTLMYAEPIILKALIQNIGQGIADSINVEFSYPSNIFAISSNKIFIKKLPPGETRELSFELMTNKLYTANIIPISIKLTEKHNKFSENKDVVANLNTISGLTTIKIQGNDDYKQIVIKEASLTSDVDKNIPKITKVNTHKYALIIGNEDYSSKQSGLSSESNVEYAMNDAKVFYEYAINTLGIPKENCFLLLNATSGEMTQKINVITQILTRLGNSSELIFFYAGHGHPEENTKIPYLIPVDVSATNIQSAIKVTDLYAKFAQTKTNRITVFLDACFTGGGRDQGLIASRAVKVVPKADMMNGNMVRFSATSNEQSALPYKEKQHGMFTYFLLKKLQETKGQVSYQELSEYIKKQVALESLKINYKEQDPQVDVSRDVQDTWVSWRINE